jgi:hypothetical protein
MAYDQEFLDLLDYLAGDDGKQPGMFTPAWWDGGYGEAYLATNRTNRKRYVWLSDNDAQRYAEYDA